MFCATFIFQTRSRTAAGIPAPAGRKNGTVAIGTRATVSQPARMLTDWKDYRRDETDPQGYPDVAAD